MSKAREFWIGFTKDETGSNLNAAVSVAAESVWIKAKEIILVREVLPGDEVEKLREKNTELEKDFDHVVENYKIIIEHLNNEIKELKANLSLTIEPIDENKENGE